MYVNDTRKWPRREWWFAPDKIVAACVSKIDAEATEDEGWLFVAGVQEAFPIPAQLLAGKIMDAVLKDYITKPV